MIAALRGGPVALLAAFGSVLVCAVFVSLINRTERQPEAHVIQGDADGEPDVAPHHA